MKNIDPVEALRQVGGGNPHTEELAEFWAGAHDRMESAHHATMDSKLSYGGGDVTIVSERGDARPFPQDVAAIGGDPLSATEPSTFGNPVTPAPFDGFGDAGSGVDKIVKGSR